MRKIFLLTLFCVFTLLAVQNTHAAWYQPLEVRNIKGVLIESSGPVKFTSKKGTEIAAVLGTELEPGTIVQAGEGGSAKVMLMDGELIQVSERKSYVVGTTPSQEEKKSMMRGLTIALNEAAKVKLPAAPTEEVETEEAKPSAPQQPRVYGMVKMGSPRPTPQERAAQKKRVAKKRRPKLELEAIYPAETTILMPKNITFAWNMNLKFPKPVVVFEGPEGLYKRFDIDPKSPKSLTASAKELGLHKGNKYSWYLASRSDKKGRGRTRRFNFTIMSEAQEKSLKKDLATINETASTDDGRAFLTAQLYYNHKMMYDMVQTLLPLWNKNKSPAIKKLLKLGYARMGRASEARKYQ